MLYRSPPGLNLLDKISDETRELKSPDFLFWYSKQSSRFRTPLSGKLGSQTYPIRQVFLVCKSSVRSYIYTTVECNCTVSRLYCRRAFVRAGVAKLRIRPVRRAGEVRPDLCETTLTFLGIISVDGVGSGCGDGVLVAGWELYGVWRRSSYQRKESEGTCSVLQCIATQYVSIDLCSLPYAWYIYMVWKVRVVFGSLGVCGVATGWKQLRRRPHHG